MAIYKHKRMDGTLFAGKKKEDIFAKNVPVATILVLGNMAYMKLSILFVQI